jgi:diguanylate cyclase (GGDEF)-like protein/PAS domain S-box-containing protein
LSDTPLLRKLAGIYRRMALIALLWTLLVGAALFWDVRQNDGRAIQLAETEAKTHLQKDLAFRRWATKHGGLYIPVTAEDQPSPLMAMIPERDVTTPSGRQLTLYNPATILRLLMETQSELYGIKARITGTKYLNPVNAPDEWETKALGIIARTLDDYSEVTTFDGKPAVRRMQPMIMEEGCMKCHAWTGIKVGELRGATDVAIPLGPYFVMQRQANQEQALTHGGVWLLGIGFIAFTGLRRRTILRETFAHEELLRKLILAVEQSASGIMITDKGGVIEYANQRLIEIGGYTSSELMGQNPRIFKSGETDPTIYASMWSTLHLGQEWRGEFKNRKKSGEVFWCMESISPVKDEEGDTTHFVAVIEDVSDRKYAEDTIRRLALYDPLTELPNRRLLSERLQQAQMRSQRDGASFALLYLDLDRFKTVNDTLGHGVGDHLLKSAALRFQSCLRDTDTLARLGGDEFAILAEEIMQDEDVVTLVERLLASMVAAFDIAGHHLFISTSIGISVFPTDTGDTETLLRNADVAMYDAKANGKNTFRFFNPALDKMATERLTLETGLREALDRGELFLEYQPKQDTASGRIFGMEALLRWRHPQLGLIGPNKFIPLAEEIREIDRIGSWVVRTACEQTLAWRNEGLDLTVSVNLSPLQFLRGNLDETIMAVLKASGLPAEALELEITESALMDNPDQARAVMMSIRTQGPTFSIDDFGTGYSSLSHLKLFPISTLKIDRSFVRDITQDENDRSIAAAVIALGRSMNLKVIAEGVETAEQQQLLTELGCHSIQGYYLARPLSPQAFGEFVRAHAV